MTARPLDGAATAAAIKLELRHWDAALVEGGIRPGLGTLLMGDDRWADALSAIRYRHPPRHLIELMGEDS